MRGRGCVDRHLRSDFVRSLVRQTQDQASLNDDFVPPRACCQEERRPKTRYQGDPGADFTHNATAFEIRSPAHQS